MDQLKMYYKEDVAYKRLTTDLARDAFDKKVEAAYNQFAAARLIVGNINTEENRYCKEDCCHTSPTMSFYLESDEWIDITHKKKHPGKAGTVRGLITVDWWDSRILEQASDIPSINGLAWAKNLKWHSLDVRYWYHLKTVLIDLNEVKRGEGETIVELLGEQEA